VDPKESQWSLNRKEGSREVRINEMTLLKRQINHSWLSDEKGPIAKEFRQPLDAGKGKKIDSLPEPPERNAAQVTPSF
jgi:hypothetical protein